MNKGTKIGLFTSITALGAGLIWYFTSSKDDHTPDSKAISDSRVKKIYGEEDQFTGMDSQRIKAAMQPSNFKFDKNYKKDLKAWGTKEGIIDVSNDEKAIKKKKKLLTGIGKIGDELVKQQTASLQPKAPKNKPSFYSQFYKWLVKEFNKTQVTITNTSTETKTVRLWGGNKGMSISPPAPADVEDHTIIASVQVNTSVTTGIHPQGMVYNPANGLTYIANQLSNNVTVLDNSGRMVSMIQLQPSNFPGYNSPVSIAVNTDSLSPKYGYAYVVGSVAGTISEIDRKSVV